MNVKKLILAIATLIAIATPALAGGPGVPTGNWCEIESRGEWTWFKRGKCARDDNSRTLILKANGDYSLTGLGDDLICKVDQKSYFKGWADYSCIVYGGRAMKQPKSTQKFTFNTANGQLGLNSGD